MPKEKQGQEDDARCNIDNKISIKYYHTIVQNIFQIKFRPYSLINVSKSFVGAVFERALGKSNTDR